MTMENFKVGDRVRAIDTEYNQKLRIKPFFKYGDILTIKTFNGDSLSFIENWNVSWRKTRFTKYYPMNCPEYLKR